MKRKRYGSEQIIAKLREAGTGQRNRVPFCGVRVREISFALPA